MKRYLFGVYVLILFLILGISSPIFDGWQNGGGFFVNGNLTATTINNVKVLKALITQGGTSAPSFIILENTIGFTPSWTRISAGVYTSDFSTLAGTTDQKVTVLFTIGTDATAKQFNCGWNETASEIDLNTFSGVGVASDLVSSTDTPSSIEIKQYP